MASYFPIHIRENKTGKEYTVERQENLPKGIEFTIIETRFGAVCPGVVCKCNCDGEKDCFCPMHGKVTRKTEKLLDPSKV